MDTATQVQTLDVIVCISHSINILGKVCIPVFSLQLCANNRADLGMATSLGEGNS